MTNELQTKLDTILLDKNTNLLPENLKQGVTCLGINGTAECGSSSSAKVPVNEYVKLITALYPSTQPRIGLGGNMYYSLSDMLPNWKDITTGNNVDKIQDICMLYGWYSGANWSYVPVIVVNKDDLTFIGSNNLMQIDSTSYWAATSGGVIKIGTYENYDLYSWNNYLGDELPEVALTSIQSINFSNTEM